MTTHRTSTRRHALAAIAAMLLFTGSMAVSPSSASASYFSDISSSAFKVEITWLVDVGVTTGCGNGRFCPRETMTRAEMAGFLARSLKLPATSTDYFADDEGHPLEADINRIRAAGVTTGCGGPRYCPNASVTRGEMASFLVRALTLPPSSHRHFWDDNGSMHEENIDALAASRIATGCAEGRYCPNAPIRREQMAAFLHRSNDHLELVPVTSPIGMTQRPYLSSSPWNTPISGSAAIDPNSSKMIATIDEDLSSSPTQYTFPVYYATSSTPRRSVTCLEYRCTIVTATGFTSSYVLNNVPIPVGAKPSSGTDGQMIIIDPITGTEWDFWQAEWNGSSWSAANGSVYNVKWNGTPTRYNSRGAGVPYLAGLIRPWEIQAGRIDHALAFAYPSPRESRCVWPASKTDGNSSGTYSIPEGARLQLDPRYTDADFNAWGLDRTGRIIARAMQDYGMFLIDVSGRPKIYAENLEDNPYATRSWDEASIRLTSSTVENIPVSALRVLRLPNEYWSGSSSSMHGSCME